MLFDTKQRPLPLLRYGGGIDVRRCHLISCM